MNNNLLVQKYQDGNLIFPPSTPHQAKEDKIQAPEDKIQAAEDKIQANLLNSVTGIFCTDKNFYPHILT